MTPTPPVVKPRNTLAVFLIIISLFLAATASFFAYQTVRLSTQLTQLGSTFSQPTSAAFPTSTEITKVEEPQITIPVAGSIIRSPLKIEGKVPPGWMFEGVFPIKLIDSGGNTIAQGLGKEVIPGSWQKDSDVDFTVTLTFVNFPTKGFLVLDKDNPSGLPQNDRPFSIPVFGPSAVELK